MFRFNPLRLRRLTQVHVVPLVKVVGLLYGGYIGGAVFVTTALEVKNHMVYPNRSLPMFQGRVNQQIGPTCLYHAAANLAVFNTGITESAGRVHFPLFNQRVYDQIKDWSYWKLYYNLSEVPEIGEVYYLDMFFGTCTNQSQGNSVQNKSFQDKPVKLKILVV